MDKLKDIPVLEWELPINVYKLTFDEIKLAFDDQITDTETITDRTIKILGFFCVFLSGIGAYYFKYHPNLMMIILISILSIINIHKLYKNLKARSGVSPGMHPNQILTRDFDKDWDDEKKEKLLYKNLVEQYWNATNRMIEANEKRIHRYDISLTLTMITVLISSLYLGYLIYYP